MIPALTDIGSAWRVLPPGVHDATMAEVESRFAINAPRKALYEGFVRGAHALKVAGCRTVYLDGSFLSDKPNPGDFDACWDPERVDVARLDPVLLDFSEGRLRQKQKYRGEFFPSSAGADGLRTFVEFFQTDRHTGSPKGIVRIQLRTPDKGTGHS